MTEPEIEDAGQLLIVGFHGHAPPPELHAALRCGHVGGVIWFQRNIESTAQVGECNRELVALGHRFAPPVLCVDQEGGRVQRLGEPVLQLPPMLRLGTHNDTNLTEQCAWLLGSQLRMLGFNLNCAPVLDIWTNPHNRVIGDRAFGATPEVVVAHGRAMLQGFARAGLGTCPKHFPGHGDTLLDSHVALPTTDRSLQQLEQRELIPFRQLLPWTTALMTAHIVVPQVDPHRPATLSSWFLQQLLRDNMGYEGVVVSDDLEMGALSRYGSIAERALAAVQAGCDALLVCSSLDHALEARNALVARASADAAFSSRVTEALTRVRRWRRALAQHVSPASPSREEPSPERLYADVLEMQRRMDTLMRES
jgi:beta-N-acetylhexosaminidase